MTISSGSAASADVQAAFAGIRGSVRERLHARIERKIAEGLLAASKDAEALAGLVMAAMQGLSVLARDGASRTSLLKIVGTVLQAWPEGS